MEFEKPSLTNFDLAKFLKNYMTEWNMSEPALSEDLGVSNINPWVHGHWPRSPGVAKLKDYFGIDASKKFAYYTSDGKLMFEGPADLFLRYLDISRDRYLKLNKMGKIIRKDLPITDVSCDLFKTYDVSASSIKLSKGRIYEAYEDDVLVAKGSFEKIAKEVGLSTTTIGNIFRLTSVNKNFSHKLNVYHVGYDFKRNIVGQGSDQIDWGN